MSIQDISTDAATIATLAQQALAPEEVRPDLYALPNGSGGVSLHDYRSHPDFPVGHPVVLSVEALSAYVHKHGDEAAETWIDQERSTVTTVLDANGAKADGDAGWGRHRVTLQLRHSNEWTAWTGIDGRWLEQVEFAEFLESHATDIYSPSAAELIEIARSIESRRSVKFKSGERAQDGTQTLIYEETAASKAGEKGQLEIPQEITLALRPYLHGQYHKITARFRFRIKGEALVLGIILNEPERKLEKAFEDLAAILETGREADDEARVAAVRALPGTIYVGTPPDQR